MSKNNFILIILLIAAIGASVFAIYKVHNVPVVRYVRSQELVYGYEGMKEAQKEFDKKKSQWNSNLDTLKFNFQKSLSEYNLNLSKYSTEEKKQYETSLSRLQNDALQYQEVIGEKIKKEEDKMTQGVLNQINSFVETYSKNHSYNLVMGTTASGNILFADEHLDITSDLLKELNASYKK